MVFVDLDDWASTRAWLHKTLQVISAVPRAFAPPRARWWHIGFQVRAGGWWSDPFPLPDGSSLLLGIRTADHAVVIETGSGLRASWDLGIGAGPGALAVMLFEVCAGLGLTGLDPERYSDPTPLVYEPEKARRYFDLIAEIDRIFNRRRRALEDPVSPVLLWPHGFDLAFEWFGGREIGIKSNGETGPAPAQLNLGWSPGEESHPAPYFYSNPWPFEKRLLAQPLPEGASWFDQGWQGSIFPYEQLVGDPAAEERLLEYSETVFRLAYPTLIES